MYLRSLGLKIRVVGRSPQTRAIISTRRLQRSAAMLTEAISTSENCSMRHLTFGKARELEQRRTELLLQTRRMSIWTFEQTYILY